MWLGHVTDLTTSCNFCTLRDVAHGRCLATPMVGTRAERTNHLIRAVPRPCQNRDAEGCAEGHSGERCTRLDLDRSWARRSVDHFALPGVDAVIGAALSTSVRLIQGLLTPLSHLFHSPHSHQVSRERANRQEHQSSYH